MPFGSLVTGLPLQAGLVSTGPVLPVPAGLLPTWAEVANFINTRKLSGCSLGYSLLMHLVLGCQRCQPVALRISYKVAANGNPGQTGNIALTKFMLQII